MRIPIRFAILLTLALADVLFAESVRSQRLIVPSAEGPNVLIPDADLLSRARPMTYSNWAAGERDLTTWSGGLEDLRIYDATEREVPYLLVPPPAERASWAFGRVLAIASTKTSSGFEVDLGRAAVVDRLRFDGIAAPFLKRYRLEGSGDRARWTLLIAEGTLFDLPEEKLESTVSSFEPGSYRYFRVTWDDRSSARAGSPTNASARTQPMEARTTPVAVPLTFVRLPSEPGHSRFRVRLPGRNLPVLNLRLMIASGNVMRRARVTEARYDSGRVVPVEIGSSMLRRAERGDVVATDLTIPIERPSGTQLELDIDDGSNPSLGLSSITGELAPLPTIYFESADGSPLHARFGDLKLKAPKYDLEAMRHFISKSAAGRASWGAFEKAVEAPTFRPDVVVMTGGKIGDAQFAYSRSIPEVKAGLVTLRVDASVLAHARTDLADVRIANEDRRQVPYLLEHREEPLIVPLAKPVRDESEDRPGFTSYDLTLPFDRLPGATLILETSNGVFERTVIVERVADDGKSGRETISRSSWVHSDPENEPPALSIELPETGVARLRLVIDEGDNAPLSITRVRLLLPSRALRFYHPGTKLTLLYGDEEISPPRYDLALLSTRLFGADSAELTAAEEKVSGDMRSDVTRAIFWGVIVAAVVALLVIMARLLRGEPSET